MHIRDGRIYHEHKISILIYVSCTLIELNNLMCRRVHLGTRVKILALEKSLCPQTGPQNLVKQKERNGD
jgi:hypothetical protein